MTLIFLLFFRTSMEMVPYDILIRDDLYMLLRCIYSDEILHDRIQYGRSSRFPRSPLELLRDLLSDIFDSFSIV
jgi:hypothetical protein